jgi:SAM-dependent methyltransferase
MKTADTLPTGYDAKPENYFGQVRAEMLAFVPAGCRRILDVGCSQGNFGLLLKRQLGAEVWGLEPVAAAAADAATKLDRVIHGLFAPNAGLPAASFDAIVFNDVIEHLPDRVAALRFARTLLAPGGVIVASIPNIRHFPTQWEIVVQGDWRYRESGILDRTHVSFFTRKSIPAFFAEGGFTVEKIIGINPGMDGTARKWFAYRILNFLTLNRLADMKFLQFGIVARPASADPGT